MLSAVRWSGCALLLCAAVASAAPPEKKLKIEDAIRQLLNCPQEQDTEACISTALNGLTTALKSVVEGVATEGVIKPVKVLGRFTISANDIKLAGADTLSVDGVRLNGNKMQFSINAASLNLSGNVTADIPILGEATGHVIIEATGLKITPIFKLALKEGKLQITDLDVKTTADKFVVKVDGVDPESADESPLLSGPLSSILKSLLKAINNKETLENKLLPFILEMVKPTLLEGLNEALKYYDFSGK